MKKCQAEKQTLWCDFSLNTLLVYAPVDINGLLTPSECCLVGGGWLYSNAENRHQHQKRVTSVCVSINLEIVAMHQSLSSWVDFRAATVWRHQPEGVSAPSGISTSHKEKLRPNLQSKTLELDLISSRQHFQSLTTRGDPDRKKLCSERMYCCMLGMQ